jgi:hypothetical protein
MTQRLGKANNEIPIDRCKDCINYYRKENGLTYCSILFSGNGEHISCNGDDYCFRIEHKS